jgi:hypothetical protein
LVSGASRPGDCAKQIPTRRTEARSGQRRRLRKARKTPFGAAVERCSAGGDGATGVSSTEDYLTWQVAISRGTRAPKGLLVGVAAVVAVVVAVTVWFLISDRSGGEHSYTQRFDVDRGSLDRASFSGNIAWRVEGGSYSARGGALTGAPTGAGPAVATVDVGSPPRTVSATYVHVSGGSGLVFRYKDNQNYWSIVAVPEYGTWNVNKIVGGRPTFVANTGNNLDSDSGGIGVVLAADTISVLVDGKPSMRVDDKTGVTATRFGLLSVPSGTDVTRWESLSATTR